MAALSRALLALAAVAAALLGAEAVARLAFDPPRYHNEPLQLDPELGFRGIPGHRERAKDAEGAPFAFALNAQGLRGREIPSQRAADGVLRVAFVGDSFLVGAGVPEEALLSTLVGDALAASGTPTEVYNLSAADYGTAQELLLLRRFGPGLEPDVVVLAVYPHNDVANNFEGLAGRTAVSPGDFLRPYLAPEGDGWTVRYTHPLPAWLRSTSQLYALLERRVLAFAARRGVVWLHPQEPRVPAAERIDGGQAPEERLEVFRSHAPHEPWERAWQRTFGLLSAFRGACEALSARLLVLVIPDLHQVRRAARDIELDLLTREIAGVALDRWLDWNLPERRLAEFLRRESIEATLLLPALRRAVRAGADVYLPDRHLNVRGHAIAAEAVAEALAGSFAASLRAPTGRPVRLPRAARAPRLIEPGSPAHRLYRSEDWVRWEPTPDAGSEGALSLPGALVAVPARGRELVVRGIAVARRYPLDVEIAFVGGPRQSFRIDERGPFVLRLGVPRSMLATSDGYAALRFHPGGEASSAEASTGLIVREVGFVSP